MAKKRKKKALLPKRIAGVKVPRTLRRGRAAKFLRSPLGVALISEAAVAAGAYTVGKQSEPGAKGRRVTDDVRLRLSTLADRGEDAGQHSAEALKGAFAAAAAAFADALRSGADAIEPSAKKPTARAETARAH